MRILFLTYYFEPDLCAGSFRNSSLFKELINNLRQGDVIDVVTTKPNRYDSFEVEAKSKEEISDAITVCRVDLPKHGSGMLGQVKAFRIFYKEALRITEKSNYDLVYASSSRLFTAFLGAKVSKSKNANLYLDIRDIFKETILDVYGNNLMKFALNVLLTKVENYTFKKAQHINLVSKGFESYFKKYKEPKFSFFTNGIDDIFLNFSAQNTLPNKQKTILYAGNIGESQGLDTIIPQVAVQLADSHKFVIIGDGGAKHKLVDALKTNNIKNVILKNPIKRNLLIEEYNKADFLFLHLNHQKAFERVLPSKLFEYGAFNKPIIAGVNGYASTFLKENMDNIILFNPGDAKSLGNQLKQYEYKLSDRSDFVKKYSRSNINKEMVKSILKAV